MQPFRVSRFTEDWGEAPRDQLRICDDHFPICLIGRPGRPLDVRRAMFARLSVRVGRRQGLLGEDIGSHADPAPVSKVDR